MTIRTGIADAPPVTLGEGGREQIIPVLEAFPNSEKRPGSTSVAAMAEFFTGGGGVVIPQIQRLFLDTTNFVILDGSAAREVDQISAPINIPLIKEENSLIAGNDDFYTIEEGRVRFSAEGAYRITIDMITRFEGTGASPFVSLPVVGASAQGTILTNVARFISVILLSNIINEQIILGGQIVAVGDGFGAQQAFANITAIIRASAGEELQLGAQVYNNGSIAAGSNNLRWRFDTLFAGSRSEITIERIAN